VQRHATMALPSEEPALSRTLRVNQLDATRLDGEICTLLKQQFADVFLWQSGIWDSLQPEIDVLIRTVFWRFTIWVDAPTPGGQLQNVRYANAGVGAATYKPLERRQKFCCLAVNVLLPWLAQRLRDRAQILEQVAPVTDSHLGERFLKRWIRSLARWYLRNLVPRFGAAYVVAAAINFLLFLRHGVYSTLSDRFLNVQLVHIDPAARRQVAFEYMNRVMIWNGVSEFLMTVMPLMDLPKVRRWLARKLFPRAVLAQLEVVPGSGYICSCELCGASPMTLPMRSNCGHFFCYFCIASEQMEHPRNVECPRCNLRIEAVSHA